MDRRRGTQGHPTRRTGTIPRNCVGLFSRPRSHATVRRFALNLAFDRSAAPILDRARRIRRLTLGSVVKKRRKKMRKHKYKKLLSRMRHKKK